MAHGSRTSAARSTLKNTFDSAIGSAPETREEEEAAIQELIGAFDTAHEAAQDTIAAADRNLTLMQECTRELRTTLNVVRWSNEHAIGHNILTTQADSAQSPQFVSTEKH